MQRYGGKYDNRIFMVSTQHRNTSKYPNPSSFTYELPIVLNNVGGISVRDYHFSREKLVNANNKTLSYIVDGTAGSVSIIVGNYATMQALLDELNARLTTLQVTFSIDTVTGKVKLAFSGVYVSNYIILQPSSLLTALGYVNGICLYRTSAPSGVTVTTYQTTALAENAYDIWRPSHLILQIKDVESILSENAATSRASAILFDADNTNYVGKQTVNAYMPLLQVVSRLKTLQINLLNMDGELYDLQNTDASFIIEFFCLPSETAIENFVKTNI